MVPMMLYEALSEHLPPHETSPLPRWWVWTELPPELQRRAARVERAAWIRARATPADHAALPAALKAVEEFGAAVAAAHLAAPMPPVIELSAAERRSLEDLEATGLAAAGWPSFDDLRA